MKVAIQFEELNRKLNAYNIREQQLDAQRSDLLKELIFNEPQHTTLTNQINNIQQIRNEIEEFSYPLKLDANKITGANLKESGWDEWRVVAKGELKRSLDKEDQKAYEYFVQGFLDCYEKHVSKINGSSYQGEYAIYFDWGGKTKPGSELVIYIYPGLTPSAVENDTTEKSLSGGQPAGALNSPFPPPPSASKATDPPKPTGPPPPTAK